MARYWSKINEIFGTKKLESLGYHMALAYLCDARFSRRTPTCDGRTDRHDDINTALA